jgi:transposase InsO family protein
MTALQVGWYRYYELTMYFDVFTKQIIGYAVTDKRGCRDQYFHGLNRAIENVERVKETCVAALERGSGDITIFHTDQGSVYTSKAYNQIIKEHGLVRSCSRAGKPTDNPVNESLNSWIKEELYCDFGLDKTNGIADVKEVLKDYVEFYNSKRPCWSLNYKTPDGFFEEFIGGKIKWEDTFEHRILDPTPKFIQKKLKEAEETAMCGGVGSSNKELFG